MVSVLKENIFPREDYSYPKELIHRMNENKIHVYKMAELHLLSVYSFT